MRLAGWIRKHGVITGNSDGNRRQNTTDHYLNEGPLPDKIERPFDMRFGPAGPRGIATHPATGGLQYIGHVPLVHVMRTPMANPTIASDDRAHVGAIYAGNPQV